jgi:hypothetical protein
MRPPSQPRLGWKQTGEFWAESAKGCLWVSPAMTSINAVEQMESTVTALSCGPAAVGRRGSENGLR